MDPGADRPDEVEDHHELGDRDHDAGEEDDAGDVPGAVVGELDHAAEDGVVGLAAEGAGPSIGRTLAGM